MPPPPSHAELIDPLLDLARAAGAVILQVYAGDFAVRGKADASPVTQADEDAERVILAGLAQLDPTTPVVAEEAVAAGRVPQVGERFWLVDPLDGTREFVNRNGEFTVNIALIEHGEPVLGVVYVPVTGRMFAGARGLGAFEVDAAGRRRSIACRSVPAAGMTVLASRSHGDSDALNRWLATQRVAQLSTAYPRFGRTMEWDIAAGHAVLAAAGGSVHTMDAQPMCYSKPGFENPDFVARGLG